MERVYYVKVNNQFITPPVPVPHAFRRLWYIRTHICRIVGKLHQWTYERLLESYSGRKLQVYIKAVESLRLLSVSDLDAILKIFVKAEKINIDDKPDPAPRIISPRDPRYNVELGRYLRPAEGAIYQAFNTFLGFVCIAKGLNAKQRGRAIASHWEHFKDPRVLRIDLKRMDQHTGVEALQYEHGYYLNIYERPALLQWLLSKQLVNKCKAFCKDGKVVFKKPGSRCSGDMNTALGNNIIATAILIDLMRPYKWRGVVDGDDGLIIVESNIMPQVVNTIQQHYLEFGYQVKVDGPYSKLEECEFCQARPIWTPDGYVMVRNYPNAISKDTYSLVPLDNKKIFDQWCTAIGLCGISLTGGIPIYQDFYTQLIRTSKGLDHPSLETGMSMLAKGMDRKYSKVHPRTRVSFYDAFNVLPDQQENIEAFYQKSNFTYSTAEVVREASRLPTW